jgi:hypothetical protein
MSNIIILRHNGGQLCNQLANFAAIYAFCLEKNHRLFNPTFYQYSEYFEHFRGDLVLSPTNPLNIRFIKAKQAQVFLYRILTKMLEKKRRGTFFEIPDEGPAFLLPPSISNIGDLNGKLYFFCGWFFRNPDGVKKYKKEIKELFKPHHRYQKNIDKFVKAFPPNRLIIGVHIRHRDYRTHEGGKYFFSIERYKEEMDHFQKRYKKYNPYFVIFSDEPRDEIEFEGFDVLIAKGNLIEDLYSMSKVDFVIGPPSTFNMWAAWYGELERYEIGINHKIEKFDNYLESKMNSKTVV